ncbi:MAG: transglycosylase domain-containing protein [Bacteroidota bacterium]|nr:transglycosylase domain-containing protein [Bacteroidota bacterium]
MENLSIKQKKYLKNFWIIILSPIAFLFILFFAIAMGWLGYMPSFEDLENPNRNLASEVYSEDGHVLGTYYLEENRNNITYKDLSPYLVQALIAREDHRFQKHSGIDEVGLFRVIGKTILLGNSSQGGGSTITQQLAKNLYQRDSTDYGLGIIKKTVLALSKFREWVIAVKLERNYSKEEIVTMYFNTVSFGSDAYGVKAAAREYFNKSADSLKIEEAALLVGMLKGTSRYSPVRNPERAMLRRNDVMEKMCDEEFITKEQLDSLKQIPIERSLKYTPQGHDSGLATYLREYIRKIMNANKPKRGNYSNAKDYRQDSLRWSSDPLYGWLNKNFKSDGSKYNLYRDGLKIYTTINSRMQDYAEQALRSHLATTVQPGFFSEKKGMKKAPFTNEFSDDQIENRMIAAMHQTSRYRNLKRAGLSEDEIFRNFKEPVDMRVFSWKRDIDTTMTPWDSIRYYKFYLRASFMAVDPHTGYIKAYVGGPDYRYFQYDGVMDQKRQVGSTIKPFLYSLAMQQGFTPCSMVPNTPVTFRGQDSSVWSPKNATSTKHDGEMVPLWWGLANSVNYISAFLMQQIKPQPLVELMRKVGVKSDIPPVPSLCVGTSTLSLYELVGAYTVFPNKGVYTQPILVTHIEDKNSNVLTNVQPQKSDAMSEQTAFTMVNMLRRVVQGGTAARLGYKFNLRNEIGGKTGTTNDNSDGWFVGVTPNLVAGGWVGGEEQGIHFNRGSSGEGAAVALPIFAMFMQKVYADPKFANMSKDVFDRPSGYSVDFSCPVGDGGAATQEGVTKDAW